MFRDEFTQQHPEARLQASRDSENSQNDGLNVGNQGGNLSASLPALSTEPLRRASSTQASSAGPSPPERCLVERCLVERCLVERCLVERCLAERCSPSTAR